MHSSRNPNFSGYNACNPCNPCTIGVNVQQILKKVSSHVVAIDPNAVTNGYSITLPGVYQLGGNAVSTAAIAITITADNVTLNLGGFTLSGSDPANQTGISVKGSNVTILNGTIQGFSLNGLYISGSDLITLDHLTVIKNGNPNFDPSAGLSAGGILYNTTNIQVFNSKFDENYGVGLNGSGLTNLLIDHCNFDGNLNSNTVAGIFPFSAYGLLIIASATAGASNEVTILNSTANENNALNTCFGFFVAGGSSITLENNVASGNYVSPTTAQQGVLGVLESINVSSTNVVLKNCMVSNISAKGDLYIVDHVVGIEVSGTSVVVEDCQVSGLSGNAQRMAGIDLEALGTDVTFRNCKVASIVNSATNPASFSYGFGLEIPIIIEGNIVNLSGNAYGVGLVVDNCIAQGVSSGVDPTVASYASAGFLIASEKDFVIKNSISTGNFNGFLVHDYFVFPPPSDLGNFPTRNGLFENNYAAGNSGYGFREDPTGTNDVYIGNKARNNTLGNYSGDFTNYNVIRTWNLSSGPIIVPNNVANLSIISS